MGRTNMVSKHQIYRVEITSVNLCEMSSGCTDLCTFFSIWDTDRALVNCQHPSIFGTLAIFALQCSFMSLSLVSKLKLNT